MKSVKIPKNPNKGRYRLKLLDSTRRKYLAFVEKTIQNLETFQSLFWKLEPYTVRNGTTTKWTCLEIDDLIGYIGYGGIFANRDRDLRQRLIELEHELMFLSLPQKPPRKGLYPMGPRFSWLGAFNIARATLKGTLLYGRSELEQARITHEVLTTIGRQYFFGFVNFQLLILRLGPPKIAETLS